VTRPERASPSAVAGPSLRSPARCSPRPRRICRATVFALAAVLFLTNACGETGARIDAARELLRAGDFDQAFEAYERLYQTGARNPRVRAGLGLILTLQPASVFAGIDLMEGSLADRSDEEVREQLMLIYLALGRIDLARSLIHPDRLSVEQVYSPEITRLRLGLSCLDRPGARALKNLSDLPAHSRREFFELLCGFVLAGQEQQSAPTPGELIANWRGFRQRDARAACEAISVLPGLIEVPPEAGSSAAPPGPPALAEFLSGERKLCRSEFPGEVSIQRERPALSAQGDPRTDRDGPALFDMNLYEPEDPGAELEEAPFRRPAPAEPGPRDGPYLPLP
jgi:hypothetical protein